MKKSTMLLAAVVLTAAGAGSAQAACDFNVVRAKGLKASMVRAYAACPSTNHPLVNTQTEGGTEACTPVTPPEVDGGVTLYSYGPGGTCDVVLASRVVTACEQLENGEGVNLGLDAGACHVTFVKAKCKRMLSTDGFAPIGLLDEGFTLSMLVRLTIGDDVNGEMTVIDYPINFEFETPSNGTMKLASSTAEALAGVEGPDADLPVCTSMEVMDIVIKDPQSRPFARLGGATRP